MAVNPNSLKNLKSPWTSETAPRPQKKSAGATVRQWVNVLAEMELSEDELREIARSKREPWPKRAAANRALRTLELGDLADFAGLLRGENNLEDLRAMGVNTEVVKRFRQKTRVVPVGDGETEEVIDREIELHDRAGTDFDRIIDHTDGKATQRTEISGGIEITGIDFAILGKGS